MSAELAKEQVNALAGQLSEVTWNLKSFAAKVMGLEPTWQQEELFDAVQDMCVARLKRGHGRMLTSREEELCGKFGISVRSGMGTGKDAAAAVIIPWALINFPRFKGMGTAPTEHQLRDVLWGEMAKWQGIAKERGGKLLDSLILQGDRMYMRGSKMDWFFTYKTCSVKADETTQASTLRGMHEDHMIIIIDEASGVPDPVMRPLEGTLTGIMNFVLMFSQPSSLKGYFADSHGSDAKNWLCLHWDAEDSPRVSRDSIRRMAEKYGRDSDYFKVFVKGEFPSGDPQVLIPLQYVLNATRAEIEFFEDDPVLLGVDVGYGGTDKSIVLTRQGNVVTDLLEYSKADTMGLAGWVSQAIMEKRPYYVGVDVIGYGAGVYDRLRELNYACVHPVNVSENASNDERYWRLRDEIWFKTRERFLSGTIKIPNDPELVGELSGIRLDDPTSDGRIKVESKKKMKARGLPSPNKADALNLTENAQWANSAKNAQAAWDAMDEDEKLDAKLARIRAREKQSEYDWMVA